MPASPALTCSGECLVVNPLSGMVSRDVSHVAKNGKKVYSRNSSDIARLKIPQKEQMMHVLSEDSSRKERMSR